MKKFAALFWLSLGSSCGVAEQEVITLDPLVGEQELEGGSALSSSEIRRSGVYEVWWSGASRPATGAVFYTSAIRRVTWVITAAHVVDGETGFYITQSGGPVLLSGGVATGHPDLEYELPSRHDVALIEFAGFVSIETEDGTTLQEYYRPLYSVNPAGDDEVAVLAYGAQAEDPDATCVFDEGDRDGSLRMAWGEFETESYGNLEIDSLEPSDTYIIPGDSGAPWLSLGNRGSGSRTRSNYLSHGVIVGIVTSVTCALPFGDHTFWGTSTLGESNEEFISEVAGSDAVFTSSSSWTRNCWNNWCHYSSTQKAALMAVLL